MRHFANSRTAAYPRQWRQLSVVSIEIRQRISARMGHGYNVAYAAYVGYRARRQP